MLAELHIFEQKFFSLSIIKVLMEEMPKNDFMSFMTLIEPVWKILKSTLLNENSKELYKCEFKGITSVAYSKQGKHFE